jgi:hypothetical protein
MAASISRPERPTYRGESKMSEPAMSDVLEPLWELPDSSPIKTEWDLFRRERARLLTEGHEGRWVLIKGDEIIGVFDTWNEARAVGLGRFGVVAMLVQQILRWYKPLRQGGFRLCRP